MGTKMDEWSDELVENGRYRSASEVVREGLRLLEIREAQLHSAPKKSAKKKSPKNQ